MFHDATLERIRTEARAVDPRKVALTAVAAAPYAVGWAARHVWLVTWTLLTWLWMACVVGWRDAGKRKG